MHVEKIDLVSTLALHFNKIDFKNCSIHSDHFTNKFIHQSSKGLPMNGLSNFKLTYFDEVRAGSNSNVNGRDLVLEYGNQS